MLSLIIMGTPAKAVTLFNPSLEGLGPAMRVLNQRQRQFVYALLETGRNDHTAAARLAGYAGTPGSLNVQAHKLAHNTKVQAALHEEAVKRLGAAKIMAVSELVRIAESSQDERVKLKALGMLMNRTGLHETTEHKVKVEHADGDESTMARILFLAKALGVDATKLLGSATPQKLIAGPVIDVESEPVEEVSIDDIL